MLRADNSKKFVPPQTAFLRLRLICLLAVIFWTPTVGAQTIVESLKSVDVKASLETALNFAQLWHSVSCCLRKSDDVQAALDFWGDAAREFDFQQVYDSGILRKIPGSKVRQITFLGDQQPGAYQVSIDSSTGKSSSKATTADFGDGQLSLGLRKFAGQSEGNDVYDTLVSGDVQLKGIKPSGFVDSAKKLLLLLSPKAVAARKANTTRQSLFSKLDPASRAYMDQYTEGLPGFTKLGTKYFKVISVFKASAKANAAVSFVNFKMGLNNSAIERDYPDLYAYLESLRDVLRNDFELRDSENRMLMKCFVDSTSQISSLEFYTADGKLVPQNPDKSLAMNAAIDIADGASRDYNIYTRSTISIMGLKMDTGRTQILMKTYFSGGSVQASSKIVKIIKPSVTGRMFHVLPTWLIDVTIPGDIQERVNRFAKELSNPKTGRGAEGVLKVPATEPHLAEVSGHAELLDNNILKLGLKVGVDTLLPKEAAQRDIRRIDEALSTALLGDLRALAPNNITGHGNTNSKTAHH